MPRRDSLTFLFFFALLALAAAPARAAVEPPVPLRTPPLMVPVESAGSGFAPEAAVRIAIDAQGAVTRVEVMSITPSSELDAVFERVLVETLSRWRYAPQRRDGAAEATTLEWRVRFPAKPHAASPTFTVSGELPGADAEAQRSAVLALPLAQQRALLAAQAQRATAALSPSRRHEAASARFVVHSDAADRKVAAIVANNLEAIFNVLATELLPSIPLQPEPYKIQVFVYDAQASYQTLLADMPTYEWSSGFYSPAGLIALHLEHRTSQDVLTVLLHEATHAFMDRHVVRPGVALPRWLAEGFAEYVGNSEVKGGRLVPGKALASRYAFFGGGVARLQTFAGARLDEAKRALRDGRGLGLEAMLGASPAIFYGSDSVLYYASSWLLVHYLRDGGDGWAVERFPAFVLYLAEGYPQRAAFRAVYGDPQAADPAFRRYVKSF
jgi:hypothetical protein